MHASFSQKGKVSGVPTVVHRTNRGGISGSSSSFSGFRPDSKDVCSEPLRDVAGARRVRINNDHDRSARPKSREQIVRDAWAAVEESKGDYCLLTNNCEHFSKGARNGTETSQQVRRSGRGGKQLAWCLYCWIVADCCRCCVLRNRKQTLLLLSFVNTFL